MPKIKLFKGGLRPANPQQSRELRAEKWLNILKADEKVNPQIQEAEQPTNRMNIEKNTLRDILIKLMRTGCKDKTLKESRQEKKSIGEQEKGLHTSWA